MPPTYKYEFITKGRMKALDLAWSEANQLHKQLSKSEVVAPSVIERVRLLRALIARGRGGPMSHDDIELLEQTLGKDMGEEKKQ